MKKGKIIALTLALSVTIMGVGYAAWQDNITIRSEVATGNIDVQFANLASFPNGHFALAGTPNKAEIIAIGESYIDLNDAGTISADKKVLTIDAGNFYPAKSHNLMFSSLSIDSDNSKSPPYQNKTELPALCFNGVIKNSGSVPVKFDRIDIEYEGVKEVGDYIRAEFGHVYKLSLNDSIIYRVERDGQLKKLKPDFPGEPSYPPFDMSLDRLKKHLEKNMRNVILYPDEILVAGDYTTEISKIVPKIQFYISKNAPNSIQGKECKIKIKFLWKQFNK